MNITLNGWLQLVIYFALVFALALPLGRYIAKIYLKKEFGKCESLIYRIANINENDEMTARQYCSALLIFTLGGFLLLFSILLLQQYLPLNPQNFSAPSLDLSFNIAASFVTNTNWQSYSGEDTLSYFSQMAGLGLQNFLSAATGMAALVALIRGIVRKNSATIGNFWVDLTRGLIYILLPLSLILTGLLVGQGVVQTLKPYPIATTIDGAKEYAIPVGPVASQVAIKQLGSNGGGFFGANSSHPFENPTPISNLLEMLAILLIPVALCHSFGIMVGKRREGRALLIVMTIILVPLVIFCISSEMKNGGNMNGKEVRIGVVNSAIWASATTASSNGSVNSLHESYSPLSAIVPLLLMQLGEVVFGGVGSGLYGMIIFVIFSVFIAGLMVGRTPEYLGKNIQAFEIKMASIAIIVPAFMILGGTSFALMMQGSERGGPWGFTEILYAFTSAVVNNGSAFAELQSNDVFYNLTLGISVVVGRFAVMLPVLAIAGSLAAKNRTPYSSGTLPTDRPLFIGILIGIIVIIGLLTFLPALALGPIAEYYSHPH